MAFEVVSIVKEQDYRGPDGLRHEKYWNDLALPTKSLSLEDVPKCMAQVAQNWPGGKNSCFLTSQLNALAIRGAVDPTTTARIQATLVSGEQYDKYWRTEDGDPRRAWASDPHTLAFILNEMGIRVGLEADTTTCSDALDRIEGRLQDGYAAVLLGKSPLGRHARLAFKPQEAPDQLFIHDPNYPEVTGMYDYAALSSFHDQTQTVIY
jgi:hypothetical protein